MERTAVRKEAGTETVKDTYEKAWARVSDSLDWHIEQDNELATILARQGRLKFPGVRDSFARKQPAAGVVTRQVLEAHGIDPTEGHGYYAGVVDGRFLPMSSYNPILEISRRVRPRTTVVMELGSGWSANLFQIYIHAGRRRAEGLHFVGAEYTEAGRTCGEKLATHEGRITYTAPAFDWTAPDMSFLEEIPGPRHVLAFSHHSIEQVEEIDPDIYAQLGRWCDSASVLHFEPVGWQRDPELLKRRKARDEDFYSEIRRGIGAGARGQRPSMDISAPETALKASAWWSYARRHNHNLLEVTAASTDVSVQKTLFDYDSLSNPLNPSTLVELKVRCG